MPGMDIETTRKLGGRVGLPRLDYSLASKSLPTVFLIGLALYLAYMAGRLVVTGQVGGLVGFASLAIGIAVAGLPLLHRPLWGLYALPFCIYLLPRETRIAGLPLFTPTPAVIGATLLATLAHMALRRTRPRISWLWFPLLGMLTLHVIHVVGGSVLGLPGLQNYALGIAPFVLFSLTVRNEQEGRRVLMFWVLAYALSGLFLLLFSAFGSLSPSLSAMARLRTEQLAGYNPNTLGWTGVLCLPLSIALALAATRNWVRLVWWGSFIGIVLVLIFSFSRAAMAGTLMTFALVFLVLQQRQKRLAVMLSLLAASLIWIRLARAVASEVAVASQRMSADFFFESLSMRTELIQSGWRVVYRSPWLRAFLGGINAPPGTHSYFAKVTLEFGLIYMALSIVPFAYLLRVGLKVGRLAPVNPVRLLARGIFIAGVVAIPQAWFGITLVAVGYAQVFWLLIGYLEVASQEVAQPSVQRTPVAEEVSFV